MPLGRDVGVYLLSQNSLLPGMSTPERFALAKLHHDGRTGQNTWAGGGPAGILSRLSVTNDFPHPELLVKEPENWFDGADGVTAYVVHHTMMGFHGVGTGLMPSERRRLTEWVGAQLAPDFIPAAALGRSEIKSRNPEAVLEDKQSVKKLRKPLKDATPEEAAALAAENLQIEAVNRLVEKQNQEIMARNGDRRRARLAAAVEENTLVVYLLYQTDKIRESLLASIDASLNLVDHRKDHGPELWSWRAPDLTVRVHAQRLGALGGPLGGEKAPRWGEQWDQAIARRRIQVSDHVKELAEDTGDPAQLALIELGGIDVFEKRTTDPKFAIRLGCADAGVVTQFLVTRNPRLRPEEDDTQFRADAAWEDGLRQVGMRFVPEHSLGDAIPPDLNQIAFWLVKRRADGPTGKPQFTPIAVLISPDEKTIMGCSPDTMGWVPYRELLLSLTGRLRDDELASEDEQKARTAAFIKTMLPKWRVKPTLLLTHAQNTRSRWPWLKNPDIVADRLAFNDGGPLQRFAIYGKHLRIARVATGDREEVPQWWAPDMDNSDLAGISKGLWIPASEGPNENRVFYSTTEKASTHHISKDTTKLTPRLNSRGRAEFNPSDAAWNPRLLQFTIACKQPDDQAEIWAMYLHQQRTTDDYRDSLGLPLALHLASLASAYALPHEIEEDAAPAEEDPKAPTDLSEQLVVGGASP
jgi:hypothetical protein